MGTLYPQVQEAERDMDFKDAQGGHLGIVGLPQQGGDIGVVGCPGKMGNGRHPVVVGIRVEDQRKNPDLVIPYGYCRREHKTD